MPWSVAAFLAAALAAVAWLFGSLSVSLGCFGDTSRCVHGESTTTVRGRIFLPDGRPAGRMSMAYEDELQSEVIKAVVETDDRGRFCFTHNPLDPKVTLPEPVPAGQRSGGGRLPADPRFDDEADLARIRSFLDEEGGVFVAGAPFVLFEPELGVKINVYEATGRRATWIDMAGEFPPFPLAWSEETDEADVCQGLLAEPSWRNTTDGDESWQAMTIVWAPLIGLFLYGAALLTRFTPDPALRYRRVSNLNWLSTTVCAAAVLLVLALLFGS